MSIPRDKKRTTQTEPIEHAIAKYRDITKTSNEAQGNNMAAVVATLPNKDINRATALTLYSGEVLKAFREKNIGLSLVKKRNIVGGKSAQFIVTGAAAEADIQTHVRGEEVIGRVLANDEVTITVSTRYVHSHFIDGLDNHIAQYDATSELAFQSGNVLAIKVDKDIFDQFKAAVVATPKTGQKAAKTVSVVGYGAATTAADRGNLVVGALFSATTALDEDDVTETPVFVTTPKVKYELVQSNAINKDLTMGNGGLDSGTIAMVAGIPITWTNHIGGTGTAIIAAGIKALLGYVTTKDVIGVVSAMDITSDSWEDKRRLGNQYVSYYALGMGVLNPTGLVEIGSDAA